LRIFLWKHRKVRNKIKRREACIPSSPRRVGIQKLKVKGEKGGKTGLKKTQGQENGWKEVVYSSETNYGVDDLTLRNREEERTVVGAVSGKITS